MANEKNLIPLSMRSERERREIQEKGREANRIVQKERRLMKDYLLALLSEPGEHGNKLTDICMALVNQALAGNTKAFVTIRDSIGQKPLAHMNGMEFSQRTIISVVLEDNE